MRKSHFTEVQISGMLKEQKAGMPTPEVCRRHGEVLRVYASVSEAGVWIGRYLSFLTVAACIHSLTGKPLIKPTPTSRFSRW